MTSTALHRDTVEVGLDPAWAAALAFRGPLLRVLGGPGTGKTHLAVEIIAERVRAGETEAQNCLLIAPTRRAAASVRDQVTRAVGATTREPLARTMASFAFGIVRMAAIREDLPTPFLLSGAEQDAVLRELLDGHAADQSSGPFWPEHLQEALTTRGFRAELRDLLMRAVEHGLDAETLTRLGRETGREEWVAAGAILDEYDQVTALSRPGAYDPAWLVTGACDALELDPDLLGELRAMVRLIVVDDAQELGAPGARLLRGLAQAGIEVVLIGDPDAAVQTFRGADPRLFVDDASIRPATASVVLTRGFRLNSSVAAADARITALIGAIGGGRQRAAAASLVADDGDQAADSVQVHVFRSAAQEATHIADSLRRAHLLDGIPWRDLAVIVRGQGRADVVRRVLAAAHVPVAEADSDLPLADEDAVRPLLALMRAAADRVAHCLAASADALAEDPDAGWFLAPEVALDLLTSPYASADAVTLRRLRRGLRRPALAEGSAAPADLLLARALARPADLTELGPEAAGARRIARMLAAATEALSGGASGAGGVPGSGGSARRAVAAEDVLWATWEAAGVADRWRAEALAGGRAGARADRDLDAVIALLAAAGDFADRLPGIGPVAFADHLAGQDVAADTIVVRGADHDRVEVLTPHAAAGRSWRRVHIAGVQEGSWPDVRVRGSLLGSSDLVDVLAGRERSMRAAQTAIRHDEARLFHVALTRAAERVQISAVRDADDQPSPYLDILDPGLADRGFTVPDAPLTLVGMVSALRRTVATPAPSPSARAARALAAATLARLAEAGVRGADPRSWWALREVSDQRPRVDPDEVVPVSPSALQTFEQCRLRWLLTSAGGEGPSVGSAALGTLVHDVLAESGDVDAATLAARVEQWWPRLGLPAGWTERAERAKAQAMVERAAEYFDLSAAQGWHRLGAEVQFTASFGRAQLGGVVDRIEQHDDGRVRVTDYKTGSAKVPVADLARHPQLGAYQAAVEAGAFEGADTSAGAALVQIGKGGMTGKWVQEQSALAADPEPGWARDLIESSAEGMAGADFPATRNTGCDRCPVRTSCPARAEGSGVV
ncbi:ATP-dependent DNA helicase [Nostocoides veronense]|uniref:DNA 3'-5' helicase n=1 Tax=Nostocoides veronense TaxID=330836 RepID=A0ABP4XUL9_9MICO